MKQLILLYALLLLATASIFDTSHADQVEHVDSQHAVNETIGKITRKELEHFSWLSEQHSQYEPDAAVVKELKEKTRNVDVEIFMATWCHDSQREVPRVLKIIDVLGLDATELSIVTLDQNKQTPDGLAKAAKITNTPTFIFSRAGEEIGRIVETPRETLEEDMLKIISGQPYKHSYQK